MKGKVSIMTVYERIKSAAKKFNCESDNIDKLIAVAYYIGREEATKAVSDKYNDVIAEQRQRAAKCRYHNMASEIVGDTNYIYSGDYSQEMKKTFGNDETTI